MPDPAPAMCTFCGATAFMSAPVAGNVVQQVHTCRARTCRDQYAGLTVEALPWHIGKRRRKQNRRRPRQRTHLV